MDKFTNGCFVFYRKDDVKPMSVSSLELLAYQNNIDKEIIPHYSGDRTLLSRLIPGLSIHAAKQGWLIRKISQGKRESRTIYGISRETKNREAERVDHKFDSSLVWDESNPQSIQGNHFLAYELDKQYQALRGKITGEDWSTAIYRYLMNYCDAFSMRSDGVIYWCPPTAKDNLLRFKDFLNQVGISLFLCEVESQEKTVVNNACQSSLKDELDRLTEEVQNFSGNEKMSTYESRFTAYSNLRKKAELYKSILGVGLSEVESTLLSLERQVGTLLDIRKTKTVHRDGSVTLKKATADIDDDENTPETVSP